MAYQRQHRITDSVSGLRAAARRLTIVLVLAVVASPSARAQTLSIIHDFENGADGRNPFAGLTLDNAGNLYGTAVNGGRGCGTVFQLKKRASGWTFNPLYSFLVAPPDQGCDPEARVIFGTNDTLYGTTYAGGGAGYGTVFNLRPFPNACQAALCAWMETVLYSFAGPPDGAYPEYSDLAFDMSGNIYGTTYAGGLSNGECDHQTQTCGVLYKLTLANGAWTESILYSFKGGPGDGGNPTSSLNADQAGNLYGTTYTGGTANFGTVYQMTCDSGGCTDTILHNFTNGADGGSPIGGLIFDPSGNMYGVGSDGGTGGDGNVFELSPSGGGWTFTVLYNFTSPSGGECGPRAGLTMDSAGNLYGTTYCDGVTGYGNVFELIPSNGGWTYKDLYDFKGGTDGRNPISTVLIHPNGNLYGTASGGGDPNCNPPFGCGVVWELTP
jgi:uncharacterized repeat protein (TIGR03803 family)